MLCVDDKLHSIEAMGSDYLSMDKCTNVGQTMLVNWDVHVRVWNYETCFRNSPHTHTHTHTHTHIYIYIYICIYIQLQATPHTAVMLWIRGHFGGVSSSFQEITVMQMTQQTKQTLVWQANVNPIECILLHFIELTAYFTDCVFYHVSWGVWM